jgi:hypothetical protein
MVSIGIYYPQATIDEVSLEVVLIAWASPGHLSRRAGVNPYQTYY